MIFFLQKKNVYSCDKNCSFEVSSQSKCLIRIAATDIICNTGVIITIPTYMTFFHLHKEVRNFLLILMTDITIHQKSF